MVDRVYQSNASGSAPQPPADPSTGYPTNGNPSQGVPATQPGDYWYHMITESLRKVIEDVGRVPDHTDLDMLAKAIHRHIDKDDGVTEYRVVVIDGALALEEI